MFPNAYSGNPVLGFTVPDPPMLFNMARASGPTYANFVSPLRPAFATRFNMSLAFTSPPSAIKALDTDNAPKLYLPGSLTTSIASPRCPAASCARCAAAFWNATTACGSKLTSGLAIVNGESVGSDGPA
jgi:hypothetical protein